MLERIKIRSQSACFLRFATWPLQWSWGRYCRKGHSPLHTGEKAACYCALYQVLVAEEDEREAEIALRQKARGFQYEALRTVHYAIGFVAATCPIVA